MTVVALDVVEHGGAYEGLVDEALCGVVENLGVDEGEFGSDGPIGMLVLSPFAKVGYSNSIHYTHSSTLRSMQEIFSVTPLLGDAANATDLSDLFTTFP